MLELDFQHDSKHQALSVAATKAIDLKRVEARDRRRAAMHEAGHHVMLRHRGIYEVDSWIERVGDPTLYESAWIGHCKWRKPHPESGGRNVMIGVAGMLAETLWKARNDPICIDDIFDLLDDPNCMSHSDWCQAGLDRDAGFTDEQRRQIEVAFDLLRGPLWPELLRQARKLIIEARDTDC